LSELKGSWKIICTRGRTCLSARPESAVMFCSLTKMAPSLIGTRRMMALPSVDFPQPDSPTRPTVSRASTSKLTSFTA
jgi:hypothetical protein